MKFLSTSAPVIIIICVRCCIVQRPSSSRAEIAKAVGIYVGVGVGVVVAALIACVVVKICRSESFSDNQDAESSGGCLLYCCDDKGLLSHEGLQFVAFNIGAQWYDLFIHLGLKSDQILGRPQTTSFYLHLLKKWKRGCDDTVDKTQVLLKALIEAERADIVKQIKTRYNIEYIPENIPLTDR